MRSKPARAFTLVELMLLVGVIVVLATLLLPALSGARQTARRINCLANLRQLGQLCTEYAASADGQVPLGCTWGPKLNFEMGFYQTPTPRCVMLGCLYQAGLVSDGQIFYEPMDSYQEGSGYNTPLNPWPPGSTAAAWQTISLYGCRPWNCIWRAAPEPIVQGVLPKLSQLHNQAIIADWVWGSAALDQRHRQGVNVLYADGSAHWVDRSALQTDLQGLDAEDWSYDNGFAADLWLQLDQH